MSPYRTKRAHLPVIFRRAVTAEDCSALTAIIVVKIGSAGSEQ